MAGRKLVLWFLALWMLTGCLSAVGPVSPKGKQASSGVSQTRIERLTRGINASHWFAQRPASPSHLRTFMQPDDFRQIKALGFRHVRLPVNPTLLLNERNPEALNEEYLGYLDDALDMILAHDLAVIVDMHPEDSFKRRLEEDDAFVEVYARFWRALAQHLSRRDPDRVFLEVLNEPTFEDADHWARVQERLLAAMREGAPEHTLIATGYAWSGIDNLLALKPVADPNVVYTFHFYEPTVFTHQGASWGWSMWRYLYHIPYPSSPKAVEPLLPYITPTRARAIVRTYGAERWNAAKIEKRIAAAAAWAQKHHVYVTCNEFGVYRLVAPPHDRNTWIWDVRTALEKYHIGWTMWDYAAGFGVMIEQNGFRFVDQDTARALGLLP